MKLLIKTLFASLIFFTLLSCEEKINEPEISDTSKIDSLTAGNYSIKAFTDTTTIRVHYNDLGQDISWEADHGTLSGEGKEIIYFAGECCVGLNTITCTLTDSTGQISENIKIEVISYFNKK